MPATIFTAKVIANTALGIWAGYNLSLFHSPKHLNATGLGNGFCSPFNLFKVKATRKSADKKEGVKSKTPSFREILKCAANSLHISAVSALTFIPNLAAYFLADRSGRHPYLIYVAIGAQLAGILQFFGSREIISQIKLFPKKEPSPESDGDSFEHIESASTKAEKASNAKSNEARPSDATTYEKYSILSTVSAALTTFLFIINTIGLAGDVSYA